MLQAGQLFAGRYRIARPIARGGMGVIYAAEHLSTEERVALKVLWPHVLGSKAAVESFQLEARLAARIGSENIVRIVDAGFDDVLAMPYLAMELLRGQTLQALVAEGGPLTPAEALVALRHVAKALDKAHTSVDREGRPAPVVHRDLKPDNLFVALREGGEAVVKVLDFGIAKVLSQGQALSQEVRGTPRFMAYEQITSGPVTPRLDVWALGLITFYLLTGRNYWRSSASNDSGVAPLLLEVLTLPFEPPSERAKALGAATWPSAFDAWFFRCVNRDLNARFASAGEAVDALEGVFGGSKGVSKDQFASALASLAAKVAPAVERALPGAVSMASNAPPPLAPPVLSADPPLPRLTDEIVVPSSWLVSTQGASSELSAAAPSGTTTGTVANSLPLKHSRPSAVNLRWVVVGAGLLGAVALLGVALGRRTVTREATRPGVTRASSAAAPQAVVPPAGPSEVRPVAVAPVVEPAKEAEPEGAKTKSQGKAKDVARDDKKRPAPKPVATDQYYDDR